MDTIRHHRTHLIIAIAAVVAISAGVTLALATQSLATDSPDYATNANGYTYGSLANAELVGEEPDLIAAVATNGAEGYVYRTDLELAEGPMPANPEEAVNRMRQKALLAADAFRESLQSSGDLLSNAHQEAVAETILQIWDTDGGAISYQMLSQNSQSMLREAAGEATDLSRIEAARKDACAVNKVSIPVYQSDGVSVIGVFTIG